MFVLLIAMVALSIVVRVILLPFRYRRWARRGHYCYGDSHSNPYLYGCRRRHRILGIILPMLALVALDRIFTRRF